MPPPRWSRTDLLSALRQFWGFESLRPVQEQAMRAVAHARDSLVVMPTGGGKSLCYQLPALLEGALSVVVSPLIALMKDQVDGLKLIGYPAAALYTGQDDQEQRSVYDAIRAGELRLLFLAPERLLTSGMLARLAHVNAGAGPRSFAIDEAHCISQWGHDFRPEYRRLAELREVFPRAAFNAFTATATPRVRDDIVNQLGLKNPEVLVGVFDRPNLTYRVIPKVNLQEQVQQIIRRHDKDAVIVYTLSRKNTEEIADSLRASKVRAEAYHAGLSAHRRREVQEAFAREQTNVVVATVAFGMGIDRSNVRCVIHASLPKSVEHYQQETGRAGRDGLPSECVLLYSGGDAVRWTRLIEQSAEETGASPQWVQCQQEHILEMQRFAAGATCRHRFLSEYFGQTYAPPDGAPQGCGACDVCLGELAVVPDSTVVAQKIISCVARIQQTARGSCGAGHVVNVLRGSNAQAVRERGHDQLSTFGLLKEHSSSALSSFINQLVDQGVLARSPGQYPTIELSSDSWNVLRNVRSVALMSPPQPVESAAEPPAHDEGVFQMLRALRQRLAAERNLAAYLVFSDASLRDMAQIRPTTAESFRLVSGVGETKASSFGRVFTAAIAAFCREAGLPTDQLPARAPRSRKAGKPPSGRRAIAFDMFERKANIADVADACGVTGQTARDYLTDFIAQRRPASVSAWIDTATYDLVKQTAAKFDSGRLKPIFDHLGAGVSYDHIAIVMAHLSTIQDPADAAANPR